MTWWDKIGWVTLFPCIEKRKAHFRGYSARDKLAPRAPVSPRAHGMSPEGAASALRVAFALQVLLAACSGSPRSVALPLGPEPKTSLKCSIAALVSGTKLRFSKKKITFPLSFEEPGRSQDHSRYDCSQELLNVFSRS